MKPKWYCIKQKTSLESKKEKHDITLTIYKFYDMLKTKVMLGECPTKYSIFQVPDSQFRLKLNFVGSKNEMKIYYITNSTIFVRLNLNVKVTNHGGQSIVADNSFEIDCCNVLANKWQYCALFNPNYLKDYESLKLKFLFTLSREALAENEVAQTQLSDDFGILLTEGTDSDVTLKSAEGIEFKVHKIILAIRSAVLKAHFNHKMRESITNIVETTWETEVLRDVLIYVYTGTAPRVDNDPDRLLAAADYYQLEGLKAHCEKALYKSLTVENAIETLELAEKYSAKKLLDDTLAYIRDGPVRMIIDTEGWSKIQSINIVKKLYEVITADEYDNTDNILEEAYKELQA